MQKFAFDAHAMEVGKGRVLDPAIALSDAKNLAIAIDCGSDRPFGGFTDDMEGVDHPWKNRSVAER